MSAVVLWVQSVHIPLLKSFLVPYNCILAFQYFLRKQTAADETIRHCTLLLKYQLDMLLLCQFMWALLKKLIYSFKCHSTHKLMLHRITNTVRFCVYLFASANIPVFGGVCLEMEMKGGRPLRAE